MRALLVASLPLLGAPLLLGIIQRTKAWFAGRRGAPLLQPYYDLARLLRKGAVYSRTTSLVFRASPIVQLACLLVALALLPLGHVPALLSFEGDLVLFAYVLGAARLFMVLAALDTGSSFEGMGASREVLFSAMAEPALLVGLAVLARLSGTSSISGMLGALEPTLWVEHLPSLVLLALALGIVYLAENARIPVDDPTTHLELTMVHEVMILDHSGVDLAFLEYAASLKLWLLGMLVVGVVVPLPAGELTSALVTLGGILLLAVATGVVESVTARLRLSRVHQWLLGAGVFAVVALLIELRRS
jgi:formate hydrogenlyase subunit 4